VGDEEGGGEGGGVAAGRVMELEQRLGEAEEEREVLRIKVRDLEGRRASLEQELRGAERARLASEERQLAQAGAAGAAGAAVERALEELRASPRTGTAGEGESRAGACWQGGGYAAWRRSSGVLLNSWGGLLKRPRSYGRSALPLKRRPRG